MPFRVSRSFDLGDLGVLEKSWGNIFIDYIFEISRFHWSKCTVECAIYSILILKSAQARCDLGKYSTYVGIEYLSIHIFVLSSILKSQHERLLCKEYIIQYTTLIGFFFCGWVTYLYVLQKNIDLTNYLFKDLCTTHLIVAVSC